jgi:hypothetical protein
MGARICFVQASRRRPRNTGARTRTHRPPHLYVLQGAVFIVARHQVGSRYIYKFDRVLGLMLSFTFLVETVRGFLLASPAPPRAQE